MASYSKQMMDLAVRWVTANPNPASPFLALPEGVGEMRAPANLDRFDANLRRRIVEARDRAVEVGDTGKAATIDRYTHDALGMVADMQDLDAKIALDNRKLTDLVNEPPTAGVGKGLAENAHHLDLGRWALAWARSGCNAFDLSPDFVAAMLLTDPSDLDIADARLPFPGVLITIPSGFAVGAEGGQYTKIHVWEVGASAIAQLDIAAKAAATIDAASTEERDAMMGRLTEARKDPSVLAICDAIGDRPDPSSKWRAVLCIHATDGAHAFTTFAEMGAITWKAIEDLAEWSNADRHVCDADRRAQRTIQRIVFGLLAYVSAVDGAVTRREPERRKPKRAPESRPSLTVTQWEVGRTVRLDPQLVRTARGGSREIALSVKHRFTVRGHYRNQACGAGRADRKRIWVAPFWKGPAEGARIVHTYKPTAPEAKP